MISAKDLRNVDLAVGTSGYVTKDVDKLVRNIVLRRTLSKPLL